MKYSNQLGFFELEFQDFFLGPHFPICPPKTHENVLHFCQHFYSGPSLNQKLRTPCLERSLITLTKKELIYKLPTLESVGNLRNRKEFKQLFLVYFISFAAVNKCSCFYRVLAKYISCDYSFESFVSARVEIVPTELIHSL